MDLHKYPVLHPQVATRIVDGTAIIVMARSAEVVMLNPIGSRIWELIDGARTVEEIAAVVVSEYDVSMEQAKQDVKAFLQKLIDADALVLQNQSAPTSR